MADRAGDTGPGGGQGGLRPSCALPYNGPMKPALSFTPPARQGHAASGQPVKRRAVLFIPGYDPAGETRYRMLFVREFIRYAKRFGLSRREVSAVEPLPAVPGLRWQVTAAAAGWETHTTYDVLRWDDIVLRDFRRPLLIGIPLLMAGLAHSLITGTLFRFFRLNWKFGGVILYPAVVILVALLACLGLGLLVSHLLVVLAPAPAFGRAALVAGVAGLSFCLFYPLGERWFVWHLMHDWVSNWQHGMGWRPDHEERVAQFAAHLQAVCGQPDVDEVLVVGHSSGATLAVDVVAVALEGDPNLPGAGGRLCLMTVGSCVPLVAENPFARRYRERLERLMSDPGLLWVEYQAPQDWMNFPGWNPARELNLAGAATMPNPVVRSARFKETVAEQTYRRMVFKPFRMHFQFLVANDHPGEYDFVMIAAGPLSLADRVLLGPASAEAVFGAGVAGYAPDASEIAAAEAGRREVSGIEVPPASADSVDEHPAPR